MLSIVVVVLLLMGLHCACCKLHAGARTAAGHRAGAGRVAGWQATREVLRRWMLVGIRVLQLAGLLLVEPQRQQVMRVCPAVNCSVYMWQGWVLRLCNCMWVLHIGSRRMAAAAPSAANGHSVLRGEAACGWHGCRCAAAHYAWQGKRSCKRQRRLAAEPCGRVRKPRQMHQISCGAAPESQNGARGGRGTKGKEESW